jgi:hypothetical protein
MYLLSYALGRTPLATRTRIPLLRLPIVISLMSWHRPGLLSATCTPGRPAGHDRHRRWAAVSGDTGQGVR